MGKRLLGGLVAVVLGLMSFGVPGALAASGAPIAISGGGHPEYPSVAVDGNGAAIAVWADKGNPGHELVRWCVVPAGGGGCTGGGALTPAGGATSTYVYATQVLVEGSTIAILADVDVDSTEYENVQEWQSTNGGQSFSPVNGGKGVASGDPSGVTHLLSAVTLPGGTSLGVGFVTPAKPPTFHAAALSAPTPCYRAEPTAEKCPGGYARLASSADADQVGNDPGNFAADGNGVLGVFRTNASSGNFGCPGGSPFGMAYVYGTGLQGPSNDYDVSPGSAGTAWRNRVTLADCGVDYIAAGGGPSGFGVLEDNQATGQTQYHRFDAATGAFDTTPTLVSGTGEQQPSVSQDGAGGVYATYLSGGIGGPVSLSYSADGGATWTGPGTLAADPLGAVAGLKSAVGASGQGWATWTETGSVYVEQFTAADAASPSGPAIPVAPASGGPSKASTVLTTSQKAGASTGASITVDAGTVGETDQATLAGANAARATGTVTYTLFSSPTCQASSAISHSTVTVNGVAAPASTPISVALAPGDYYWTASYSGDSANAPSSSACGSEVLSLQSPVAISGQATSDGRTVTVGVSCTTLPCKLQVGLTAPATAATGSAATDRKAKPRSIELGKGAFRIKKKGKQDLTLKLSGRGRRYLAKKHMAKVTLAVTEKVRGHNVVTSRTLDVKVTHHRSKG